MAVPAVMPKLGQTVESSIIVEWRKRVGDQVEEGEPLVDVETDKATVEVPSPASGTLLAIFFEPGADVPVMTTIAAIGEPGEDVSQLGPAEAAAPAGQTEAAAMAPTAPDATTAVQPDAAGAPAVLEHVGVSPRARRLADSKGLAVEGLPGTGPGGRIIERDVVAALAAQPKLSPVARAKVADGEFVLPEEGRGSGPGGRIMARDLAPAAPAAAAGAPAPVAPAGEPEVIKLAGVRKVIAERMLASLQTTAQLTLNSSANARSLLDFRQRLKASPEELELRQVTINDLILLAVARTLPQHPDLNAHFVGDTLTRFPYVNLGVAVDTPRGLMVPVIRNAQLLSLRQLSQEAKRLATACLERRATPDELSGGTFTVTNLGSLGVETFTPVLNPPEVAILGVGNIGLKPVEVDGDVQFLPHLNLSLTINHQVVDGAPGARFLQALARGLADLDLLLAL